MKKKIRYYPAREPKPKSSRFLSPHEIEKIVVALKWLSFKGVRRLA